MKHILDGEKNTDINDIYIQQGAEAAKKAIESIRCITPESSSPLSQLKKLSAVRRYSQMIKELQNDRYIFDGMALAGQITLFYSKPNTGKTLLFFRFLTDAIKSGIVKGEDIFYINADDHFKGLVTKTEIAKKYGFEMISPAEAGINQTDIVDLLEELAASGEAKGKVIILDTLKKFADMMSKASQSALYQVLRKLIAKDATVIIAGHANKYPDSEGKLIYEGTADTMNDIDCAYAINLTSLPEGDITVEFVREKNRGDNVYMSHYTYQKYEGMSYQEMIDSVTKIEGVTASKSGDMNVLLDKFESEILLIKELLADGKSLNQSEMLKAHSAMNGEGLASECTVSSIKDCLTKFTDKIWKATRGEHNAKEFTLVTKATDYLSARARG